ncbi:MAG: hypothetical protein E6Q97_27670 [Desulfurellales bacterium]|nr:MAG: hypothetical protein E6Q97_27670 [Desulfurellales bacterium]
MKFDPLPDPPLETIELMDLRIRLQENINSYTGALLPVEPDGKAMLHRSLSREQVVAAHQSIRSYMEECGKLLAREYAKLPPRAVFIVDPNKLEEPSAD